MKEIVTDSTNREGYREDHKQLSSQEFTEQAGGKVTIVCELDAKRITDLANSTLENARGLLDSYNVRKGNRVSAE